MELWFKLRDKSYKRHFVSLYRLLKRLGVFTKHGDQNPNTFQNHTNKCAIRDKKYKSM